ncbi:hypothetical protein HYV98_01805 [Candidatus Azambacteria bacterium]|nr:hypothetical protein [Candidatus Azambacteria bacterium]
MTVTADEIKGQIRQLLAGEGWDPDRLRWLIALLCEVEDEWRREAWRREEELAAGFWARLQ